MSFLAFNLPFLGHFIKTFEMINQTFPDTKGDQRSTDLFAGAGDAGEAVTVPQRELDLYVDALRSFPADMARPQPVVLVGLHHVAHLIGPHRSVPLVHHADLLPLRMQQQK